MRLGLGLIPCVRHVPNPEVRGTTISPGFRVLVPAPVLTTCPTPSCPGTSSYFGVRGYFPWTVFKSLRDMSKIVNSTGTVEQLVDTWIQGVEKASEQAEITHGCHLPRIDRRSHHFDEHLVISRIFCRQVNHLQGIAH